MLAKVEWEGRFQSFYLAFSTSIALMLLAEKLTWGVLLTIKISDGEDDDWMSHGTDGPTMCEILARTPFIIYY